jgi:hypothetical protein
MLHFTGVNSSDFVQTHKLPLNESRAFTFPLHIRKLEKMKGIRWKIPSASRIRSAVISYCHHAFCTGMLHVSSWKRNKCRNCAAQREVKAKYAVYVSDPDHKLKFHITWSRVLPEKVTGSKLVRKFLAFCGTRRFITACTRARHLSLFWVRSIQSVPTSNLSKIYFNITFLSTSGSF